MLAGSVAVPRPAAAASSDTWNEVTGNLGSPGQQFHIWFLASVGGDHQCLDDANGAKGYQDLQADVWHCGANNADLLWTITKVGTGGWQIKSNQSNGCLDNRDGQLVDGNPVKVYTCQAGNADQVWTIWQYSGSLVSEIVPRNPSGPTTFTYGITKVLSMAGTPANGSLVQLWRSGANDNNQELEWSCAPNCTL